MMNLVSIKELRFHINSGKSLSKIAQIFSVSQSYLSSLVKKYSIPLNLNISNNFKIPIPPRDNLENLYWQKKKSLSEIAKIFQTSNVTVRKWMRHHSISLRSHAENQSIQMKKYQRPLQILKESKEILSNNKAFIQLMTITNSRIEAARELNVSTSTIDHKLKELNLTQKFNCSFDSQPEKDVFAFIESFGLKTQQRIRGLIGGTKEIDIFLPEKKIGFEFNGSYWHSDKFKDRFYHQKKVLLAQQYNIRLIHIFEHEWNDKRKQKILKSRIVNILGKSQFRSFARKGSIVELSKQQTKEFLNENHLQGNIGHSYSIGLIFNNRVECLMCFGKPRFQKNIEWELLRFCCRKDSFICGGASRLFSYFLKKKNPTSILSYASLNWSIGNLYSKLGFKNIGKTKPNYWWIYKDKYFSRYQCQKKKLVDMFNCDSLMTETEIMRSYHFHRVYDAGNLIFLYPSSLTKNHIG